mmetsp:Transcript_6354/g.13875  ORF Transcript_6354/g.13875 Transcript_6354/m.13875 type:complete len:362 (+) Transcript_6354:59-1144(+)|eukprot:CAMPEP_0178418302 /NCGR_PEP_ID=MMETSP0689_2-20121128/25017_1 /TAXON_ID=160604 /ORGANISM="Amphidinium massartii, Strain CS-259" /LENGTH=361 /DNA_ID=CAMNT_0020039689 /DNA_START=43 /DNA_END=1128 /DNA_ORIENTATION=+
MWRHSLIDLVLLAVAAALLPVRTATSSQHIDKEHLAELTFAAERGSDASASNERSCPSSSTGCIQFEGNRQGYQVDPGLAQKFTGQLHPINDARPACSLESDNMELLDISSHLQVQELHAETLNVGRKEDRLRIGSAMLAALQARFPSSQAVFHVADTSRLDGAVPGEATVRNTSDTVVRNSHHMFHIDKFMPQVAKAFLGEKASVSEGAAAMVREFEPWYGPDAEAAGVDLQRIAEAYAANRVFNLWVSLTPGHIQQEPLALISRDEVNQDAFMTILMPRASSSNGTNHSTIRDSITLVPKSALNEWTQIRYRPKMRFGEAFLFSTTSVCHSAVTLLTPDGLPVSPTAGRVSAEMRVAIL